MDQETERELESLHRVKGVIEVRLEVANELLDAGWILHDVFVTDDFESRCILLRLEDTACPRCGGPARVETIDRGARIRFVCHDECH